METNVMYGIPLIVQGSEAPCFRGTFETKERLTCASGCGQVLIENYDPDQYVRIGMKCFGCGGVTWTPDLPNGEVLAGSVFSFGEMGYTIFESTWSVAPWITLTCDQQMRRELELTAPREYSIPFTLSTLGLKELTDRYDHIVGGRFELQRGIVKRAGDSAIRSFPFAWAVAHMEDCLAENWIDLHRADTNTALLWLRTFCNVVGTWGHHPRFRAIAQGFGEPNKFLHHSALLTAAAYLYKAGNKIGLSLEENVGKPNPDLYIRGGSTERIFLEVKTPQLLRWTSTGAPTNDGIDAAVKVCVKKSNGQINRSHPGALIISSCYFSPGFSEIFERAIQKAVRSRGRNQTSLAAVVGLSPLFGNHIVDGTINDEMGFCFTTTLNDYYTGICRISSNRKAS